MHPELLQCIIDERVWHLLVGDFDFTNIQYLEEKQYEVKTLWQFIDLSNNCYI